MPWRDAVQLWLAKAAVEFGIFLGVLLLLVIVIGGIFGVAHLFDWWSARKRRRNA